MKVGLKSSVFGWDTEGMFRYQDSVSNHHFDSLDK